MKTTLVSPTSTDAGGAAKARGLRSLLHKELTPKKVARDDIMHLSRQLAAFLNAGIPILEAIRVVSTGMHDEALKKVLEQIGDDLRVGGGFSDAVARHKRVFPQYYAPVLRAAEAAGSLDVALEQLALYIERDEDARRTVKSAMLYPSIILALSVVTAAVLAVIVLPRFKLFFAAFDSTLPWTTRVLLQGTSLISTYWYLLLAAFVAFAGLVYYIFRSERGRDTRDRLLLRLPVIRDLVKTAMVERFARILSAMVRAGVPLVDAMAIAGDGTNNCTFRRALLSARREMLRGEGLVEPLEHTKLFPEALLRMVRVGEDTGSLDRQLETAASYYERELGYKIKRVTSLLEPAVILVMAGVVGFVGLALVQAMYGVFQNKASL
ncbi:MAG TPA: type II secretion system F family protein [Actinomycetota bacterium]|nr:type II secretion system F family protein [Actinomycetota bacterium]